MPSAHLPLQEKDVVKMVLEFLSNRALHITQLSLERETGVINGLFSDDMLFLRQLILDGQWDDAIEFVQPLEGLESFNMKRFRYIILKHKYLELLCIKSESGPMQNHEFAVEEVVKCLNSIEQVCPTKEEYSNLCLLLTLPRLSDNAEYQNWNPSNARVDCFKDIYLLVEKLMPAEKKMHESQTMATNDRLLQLLVKGLLYESCVEFCEQKATGTSTDSIDVVFPKLLGKIGFHGADLGLLSWLQSIPSEIFSCPFEQRTLSVDVDRLEKPSLEASWSEQILVTPIKPKTFPHSAMPSMRPRSADPAFMSRSLNPLYDGLAFGLSQNRCVGLSSGTNDYACMSKSFAGFHLAGSKKLMTTSVDKLFEAGDVFTGSMHSGLNCSGDSLTIQSKGNGSPKIITKENSDMLNSGNQNTEVPIPSTLSPKQSKSGNKDEIKDPMKDSGSELYKEYQRRLQEQLFAQEKRLYYQTPQSDNRLIEEAYSTNQRNAQKSVSANQKLCQREIATSTPKAHSNRNIPLLSHASPVINNSLNDSSTLMKSRTGIPIRNLEQSFNNNCSINNVIPGLPMHCKHQDECVHITDVQATEISNISNAGKQGLPDQFTRNIQKGNVGGGSRSRFIAVSVLEDLQAIRAACFHPQGHLYAIGSNSKILRICSYPNLTEISQNHTPTQPTVLFKREKHHKGSIYCLTWNATGELIATGSNDKSIRLVRFNSDTCSVEGSDVELTMHDGTIRDLIFMEDTSNRTSLLISGGAGDCKVYLTDCETGTPFRALSGHTGHILSLYTWGGAVFASSSQDKSIRIWDMRASAAINLISSAYSSGTQTVPSSPVTNVCVDSSGRLLIAGYENAMCMLFDIRGNKAVQVFKPHDSDIRTVRFSPNAYYLLTGSYDRKIVLTDLQGDLMQPLPSIVVAEHKDKVIQCRWHPSQFSFLSTSADRTVALWSLPSL